MTTINQYEPKRDIGNGVTFAFSFDFKIADETDLDVFLIDTGTNTNKELQTITTQYTVSLNEAIEGGTVTFLIAPPAEKDIILERTEDYTQLTDIPDVATIQESVLEGSYDKNTRLIQQVLEITNRKIGLSVEDLTLTPGFDTNIQDITSGAFLQITSGVTGITTSTLASLGTITLPAIPGIAVFTGSNTFISRDVVSTGSVNVTNGSGVAGNINIDSTINDNKIADNDSKIADFSSTLNGKGASSIGVEDAAANFAGINVESILAELSGALNILSIAEINTITFTRDLNDTPADQDIPHGLSGIPVLLFGFGAGPNPNRDGRAVGVCVKLSNSQTFEQMSIADAASASDPAGLLITKLFSHFNTASDTTAGQVTNIDSTNIRVNWAGPLASSKSISYRIVAIR